jgi:hypothetical protein
MRVDRGLGAGVLLVLLSYAFRFPALWNADSTNSDAAIVGLQASHILHGETSPFLWGSGYQTSTDSFVAALFFAVLGRAPWVLMVSALSLHVSATLLVFSALSGHVGRASAFVLSLLLVLTPSSVHSYALYPPREASLFLALTAFVLVDRAAMAGNGRRRALVYLCAGCTLSTAATAADPYAMLVAPLSLGFAAWTAFAAWSGKPRLRALGASAAFAALGVLPSIALKTSAGAKNGPMTLSLSLIPHNAELLVRECLPWAMSTRIYYAKHVMDYSPWEPPAWVSAFLMGAALIFAVALAMSLRAAISGGISSEARRLGVVGLLVFPVGIGSFLVSVMVMDHFSMRYLAALTLLSPFALLPLAKRLPPARLALLLAPFLLSSAIGGWVGFGPFVRGPVPVRTAEIADDYALRALMHEKGLRYGVADYWTAYRLTFLFREEPTFVPTSPREDRYAPYRQAFEKEARIAYVFDPGRSRENPDDLLRELAQGALNVEELHAGKLRVWLITRAR